VEVCTALGCHSPQRIARTQQPWPEATSFKWRLWKLTAQPSVSRMKSVNSVFAVIVGKDAGSTRG
jgi:hypothetical protein